MPADQAVRRDLPDNSALANAPELKHTELISAISLSCAFGSAVTAAGTSSLLQARIVRASEASVASTRDRRTRVFGLMLNPWTASEPLAMACRHSLLQSPAESTCLQCFLNFHAKLCLVLLILFLKRGKNHQQGVKSLQMSSYEAEDVGRQEGKGHGETDKTIRKSRNLFRAAFTTPIHHPYSER